MSEDSSLGLVEERGWQSGLANLIRLENNRWWCARRWWVQSLVWFVVLNGILVLSLWIVPAAGPGEATAGDVEASWQVNARGEEAAAEGFGALLLLMGILPVFGVLIVTQGAIVGEKQSGTAAWILSGPASRMAFILSKLIAHGTGFLVTMVVLQGTIAYVQMSLSVGRFLPPMPIVAALSLHALHLLFYLTLTLMLGTFFNSRGPVLAIPIAILIGQGILESLAKRFAPWFPWQILPAKLPVLASVAARGVSLPSFVPIVSALLFSLAFVLLAIWRFEREEF
jgi:ABC-2 type transport system permease protein